MGSEFVLCDGASVCGSEHGFCGSVQGPGDLGCSDRVLDLSDHVAMDDQVSVEPFSGALPDEEVLGRGEPVVERRSVRRRGPFASPSAVLRGQCCCLCGRCLQRGYARHRGRRSLHVGAIACVPGEIHRLAGSVLQPCETGRHGRSGVACGVALRGFQHLGDRIVRRLCPFVDGRFAAPVRHARCFGPLPSPRASFRRLGFRRPLAAGWPVGSARGHRRFFHEETHLVLYRLHHPVPVGRGLRDEDRSAVPQSGYRIRGAWGFRTSRSAFTTGLSAPGRFS